MMLLVGTVVWSSGGLLGLGLELVALAGDALDVAAAGLLDLVELLRLGLQLVVVAVLAPLALDALADDSVELFLRERLAAGAGRRGRRRRRGVALGHGSSVWSSPAMPSPCGRGLSGRAGPSVASR
jgi:hypothetical protein